MNDFRCFQYIRIFETCGIISFSWKIFFLLLILKYRYIIKKWFRLNSVRHHILLFDFIFVEIYIIECLVVIVCSCVVTCEFNKNKISWLFVVLFYFIIDFKYIFINFFIVKVYTRCFFFVGLLSQVCKFNIIV